MGLILGLTVKNLERIAYFAAYVILSVDVQKRDQMLADLEAEVDAAKKQSRLATKLKPSKIALILRRLQRR